MKYCSRCKTEKPYSEFGLKKETKDGYRYCCRKCASNMETEKRRSNKTARASANAAAKKYREKMKSSINLDEYREKNKQSCRRYYHSNLAASREASKRWRLENKEHKRFMNTMRKKYVKQQTPIWANVKKIRQIYLNCPDGMHVDHVIPLKGKLVCGLHVENNLQYLTPLENIKKNNSFDISHS